MFINNKQMTYFRITSIQGAEEVYTFYTEEKKITSIHTGDETNILLV